MSELRDEELVAQFQKGDEQAFNTLVNRYQERLYWTARRFVNEHDDADDILQDVFLKAYEALKDFRGESSLYTWLYRITVNLSLNQVRRNKVRNILRLDETVEESIASDDSPHEELVADEERRTIEKAVARLPKQQQQVFILRYYQELSYEEIAEIMKLTVGGLKANYYHAVKKIQEYVRRSHKR